MPHAYFHKGKLLGHKRIGREEVIERMVTHLGDDPTETSEEENATSGARAGFSFLEKVYKEHL